MGAIKQAGSVRILAITNRADGANRLQHLLSTEKLYTTQFANTCQEALQNVAQMQPDIILVDDAVKDISALDVIRRLAVVAPAVPIVALADEKAVTYVREAMLAGARAFILKPINESELFATLNQLVEMESLRQAAAHSKQVGSSRRHQTIAIISPKGGAGCTTLAVNLAMLFSRNAQAKVVLVDGHSSLGDLETFLNLQAPFTCRDVLAQGAAMDLDFIKGVVVPHKHGVDVLVSSRNIEDIYTRDADGFERMLSLLATEYDHIIVDGGSIGEEQTSVILSAADKVLLVATPEMTALHRISLFLKAADENDFPRQKLFLAVNREGVKGGIPTEEISRHLNMQVLGSIPDDPGLVTYSTNRGIPLVLADPRSAVARRLQKLARQLIPEQKKAGAPGEGSLLKRLTTRFQGSAA